MLGVIMEQQQQPKQQQIDFFCVPVLSPLSVSQTRKHSLHLTDAAAAFAAPLQWKWDKLC